MATDQEAFVEMIEQASQQFDALCQARHEAGQQEYGMFTFLENDVVRMMAEELADTSNYCRMQFIKLMILQEALEEKLSDQATETGDIALGAQSFKGTKDVGWNQKGPSF